MAEAVGIKFLDDNDLQMFIISIFCSRGYLLQEQANSAMAGAAFQAKIGLVGGQRGYEEVLKLLPQPKSVCEPYPDAKEIYENMVVRYRNIIATLMGEHAKL